MEEILTIDEISEKYKIHKCTTNTYLARPEFNKFRLQKVGIRQSQKFNATDEFLKLFEDVLKARLMHANRRGKRLDNKL